MTLGNPGMKPRHWELVSELVGFPMKVDSEFTLKHLLDMSIGEYVDKFETISEVASKENALEKSMEKMKKDWSDTSFTINPYKDIGTYVVSSVDEIQLLLDDHITKAMTMKNSPYVKPFESEIL